MDGSDLALLMLDWESTQRAADELKARIEAEVLTIGKTQTVGNVRATYSAGRKSYDYEAAWRDAYDHLPDFIYQKCSYDYRSAVTGEGLMNIPCTQAPPSVTVKLL